MIAAPHPARANAPSCYPGEIWLTAEGYPFCVIVEPQGACYYCEVTPKCLAC